MPAKVNAFIDFLAGHFGVEPYWDKSMGLPDEDATVAEAKASRRTPAQRQSAAKKQGLHTDAH